MAEGIKELGGDLDELCSYEPDPALGNGGLGRLPRASSTPWAHEGIAGYGNGMRYRYGLFKQEIVNGAQHETTDEWLSHGYPWEVRRPDKAVRIRFGGHVVGEEVDGRMVYRTVDTQDVLAMPYDIPVVGYGGKTVNKLRVWGAEPVEEQFDLDAFNRGDYAGADAHRAEAEAISAILYPNDAGEHGRLLRLKQSTSLSRPASTACSTPLRTTMAPTGSSCPSTWPSTLTTPPGHVWPRAHAHPHGREGS